MMLFPVIIGVVILVSIGYVVSWASMQEKTSKGFAGFGRVIATILYLFAALILIFGITFSHKWGGKCGMMRQACMPGQVGMMPGEGMMPDMHMNMKGGMPDMKNPKDQMMSQMAEWKKEYPKEWKDTVNELNKSETK
jgi:hypothetical protein